MAFFTKYERGFFFILFILLAVISLSTAISAQQAAKAAKASDLIAQCTEPGTKCFKLQIQAEARRTAQNKCVIATILTFPPVSERSARKEEILKSYDICVEEFTKAAATSTTQTTATVVVPG